MQATFERISGKDIRASIWFKGVTCYKCGIPFAIESDFYDTLHRTGDVFFCPVGHRQRFGETEETRLKRELEQTQKQLSATEHERQVAKGNLTRLQNRIANGVCPCCNRYFSQLHRHMQAKHPEHQSEQVQKPEESQQGYVPRRKVWAFGEAKSAYDWVCDSRCKVTYATLINRLKRGVKPETAITYQGRIQL